jgi:protein TonB
MRRRLFEDLVASRSGGRIARRAYTLPFSIAIHAMVLSVALVLPMLARDEMPKPQHNDFTDLVVPSVVFAAPPPPPTIRPPAARPRRSDGSLSTPVVPRGAPPPVDEPVGYTQGDPSTEQPACLGAGCVPGQPEPGDEVGLTIGSSDGPDDPPTVVRVGPKVKPPVKVKDVTPVYPELARHAGVEGIVIIECTIDPTGRVVGAQVLRGNPLLDAAALDAVQRWVYVPTLLNGSPVSVIMTVTVRFSIRR